MIQRTVTYLCFVGPYIDLKLHTLIFFSARPTELWFKSLGLEINIIINYADLLHCNPQSTKVHLVRNFENIHYIYFCVG